MILIDDQLAFLPLQHGLPIAESLLIVRPSALLTALSAYFEVVWEKAVPLNVGQVAQAGQAAAAFDESMAIVAAPGDSGIGCQDPVSSWFPGRAWS